MMMHEGMRVSSAFLSTESPVDSGGAQYVLSAYTTDSGPGEGRKQGGGRKSSSELAGNRIPQLFFLVDPRRNVELFSLQFFLNHEVFFNIPNFLRYFFLPPLYMSE